jgi:hypothetical protein
MAEQIAPLSAKPPSFLGADGDAQKEYFAALNKALTSLESRQGVNLFNVAGALFNPGRTGQAFEAIGNAASAAGRDIERDEARAPAIAQMRAQLAGQKYEVGKQSKALGILAQAFPGTGGGGPMEALQSGNLFDPNFTQKLMSIYPTVAQDPKTGGIVKEMIDQGFKLQSHILEQRKANVPEAQLYIEHGAKVLPLLSPEFRRSAGLGGGTAPAGTGTGRPNPNLSSGPAIPQPLPEGVVPGVDGEPTNKTPEQIEEERARRDTPPATATATPVTPATPAAAEPPARTDGYTRVDGTFAPFPPGASIKLQAALVEANEKTIQASAQAKVDKGNVYWSTEKDNAYTAGNPQTISRQKNDLNILGKAAIEKPEIFGQLAKSGFFDALANALNTGAQTPWGTFSLPVDQFVSQLKLDDPDYALKQSIAKTTARIFFDNAKLAQSVLGRFTDQDAKLAQAPLAQMTDPALTVLHWVGESKLGVMNKEAVVKALNAWEDKNPGVSPRKFFAPGNSEFQRILGDYDNQLAAWIKQSPLYRSTQK